MIDFLFIALLQSVAGEPAQPVEQAPATTEQPAEQQQAAPAEEPPERTRCRTERLVGSRMGQRVCTTEAQDRALREDARQSTDRAQRYRTVAPGS